MKRIVVCLISFCFLFLETSAYAQLKYKRYRFDKLSKGKTMVGLSASGNFFRRDAIGSFNAKLGHFVFNRLNVGLGAEYRTTGNLSYQQLGGAYARYYFMNKKITPFGEANYFRGKSISRIDQQKLEASHIAASVGLAFTGILNRFGLEAYQEFNFETIGTTKSNYGLLSVRLNFIF